MPSLCIVPCMHWHGMCVRAFRRVAFPLVAYRPSPFLPCYACITQWPPVFVLCARCVSLFALVVPYTTRYDTRRVFCACSCAVHGALLRRAVVASRVDVFATLPAIAVHAMPFVE